MIVTERDEPLEMNEPAARSWLYHDFISFAPVLETRFDAGVPARVRLATRKPSRPRGERLAVALLLTSRGGRA